MQLCNSFTAWSQLFQRRVHNLEILEGFLERKQTQLLQVCIVRWRKDTLDCRAQKFHNRRLVQKCFVEWWFRLYTKKGLESVKEVSLFYFAYFSSMKIDTFLTVNGNGFIIIQISVNCQIIVYITCFISIRTLLCNRDTK